MTPDIPLRYLRQCQSADNGAEALIQYQRVRLACVGAGGLACAALPYLTRAGVGDIMIFDQDHVDATNLHRQILYVDADIGQAKAPIAAQRCREMNPDVQVNAAVLRINEANLSLLEKYDVILDTSDNFATHLLLMDYCEQHQLPYVGAGVAGAQGYVFALQHNHCRQWQSLFNIVDAKLADLSCTTQGVNACLVGMLGCLQAQYCLSLIAEQESARCTSTLVSCDIDNLQFQVLQLPQLCD